MWVSSPNRVCSEANGVSALSLSERMWVWVALQGRSCPGGSRLHPELPAGRGSGVYDPGLENSG